MMGMGFAEILLLVFLSGGGLNTDLASLLPAQSYFKSRNIDISVDKAMELAVKDPVDGKTQIAQLVALRYLADESAKLKGSPSYEQHRQALIAIGAGKKAQDPQGFAKDYATQVIAKLDGVRPPAPMAPVLREDALRWFPANATMAGAIDTRLARGDGAAKSNLGEMFKMFPQEMLNTTFGVIEKVGNIRVDRIAFAYVDSAPGQNMGEIYVRFTGKANAAWLLDGIKELNMPAKTSQSPGGETITMLLKQNQSPGIMLIGDSEFVLAGFSRAQANHEDLLNKVLDTRNGKLKHAGDGILKNELNKVPAKACGMFVGSLPMEASVGAPFPLPVMINGHIVRNQNALDVNVSGAMANNDDSVALVKQISQLRTEGIKSLRQLQGAPLPVPGLNVATMIQMLESMQAEAQGSTAKMRLLMPEDTMLIGTMWFGMRAGPVAPPPAKEEKK